jgi:hypothetical protein
MGTSTITARNAFGALSVSVLFIFLSVLGPDWYKWEAELRCAPDYKVEAIYPDMVQCSKAMDASFGNGCGCSRPENPWARLYQNYAVPTVIGVSAWVLLAGSIGTRIGLLNAGLWGSIFLLGVYYAFTNPEGIEGLMLSFGHLIYVAVVASAVVIVLHFLIRGVARLRAET